jgi:hypothetical protein
VARQGRHLTRVPDGDSTEPVPVETFAARLTDKALRCRELGHQWRPLVATWEPESRTFHRALRCPSCRSERRQVLNAHGGVVSNTYVYPDGYLATHVEGAVSGRRDVFRLEAVIRTMDVSDVRSIRKAIG